MAKEIERKFLVKSSDYKQLSHRKTEIAQAYLSPDKRATVRVRITDDLAYLTVKGCTNGCVRDEWEYPIPKTDAQQMMGIALTPPIVKTRWFVDHCGHKWEIDEFHGHLDGLTIAEIELSAADESPVLPGFVGKEVTGDPRYYNSTLATCNLTPPST